MFKSQIWGIWQKSLSNVVWVFLIYVWVKKCIMLLPTSVKSSHNMATLKITWLIISSIVLFCPFLNNSFTLFFLIILIPYTSISNKLILFSTTLFQFHKTTIFAIDRAYMPITGSINLGPSITNLDFNATHIYGVNNTSHFTHALSQLFYLI